MRTMAIVSAVLFLIMFMGVSLSSRDKVAQPVATQSILGEVMAMPTVTPMPTATSVPTVAPMPTVTAHVYCAGQMEMCFTSWCADMCQE